ncbi:N-acetylmuramoyl-L-alanine amidase family protein [Tomitella fengzijianii]|uniref:N-acetylmuramoyl-L-alanine amidase n=2 Tax=Tomitella fengzijianii TaxID=2597660 RepID=A0A516X8S4_9ACTN|nr:N-acetylmuramoyl-L-alanine amidase [Tomitella fengzijianii]QDQ99475.1 N-acetylmuramoyl-L-alanine amidase [Tomitella fengzijianii]
MKRSAFASLLLAGVTAAAFVVPATSAAADDVSDDALAGKTVFLDPGHQESAAGHDMSKQVDDGYGGTKNCQTSGMTALGGTPEYAITYNVAEIVKGALQQLGADVVMSRGATGWGGCITDRADKANSSGADVAVSIHADSTSAGTDSSNHGFHMIIPQLEGITDAKAEEAQAGGGRDASKIMRDVYKDSGFTPSNYLGQDGLDERGDVAGPALTEVPMVFVEMGNGSNPGDAKVLESADGQAKHAKAIAVGIATYLAGGGAAGQAAEDAVESAPEPEGGDGGGNVGGDGGGAMGEGGGMVDGVLDRVDDVMDLFEQLIAVNGIDSLLALINDGNIAKVEGILGATTDLADPLLAEMGTA